MCWWIFKKPKPPVPYEPAKKRALLFAINNYPGASNDLYGCLNDQNDMAEKLQSLYPGIDIRRFSDSQVTAYRYKTEVESAINALSPGATVVVMADSCFSTSVTRNPSVIKNRFVQNPKLKPRKYPRRQIFMGRGDLKWIVFSACGEKQTAADAYFNGRPNGAFSYYAIKTITPNLTYMQWHVKIRQFLPSPDFEQIPEIEGPAELLNRMVFGDEETLLICNSTHGTQTYDKHGDEADGYDEALYLYDGMLIDDDIYQIFNQIKS